MFAWIFWLIGPISTGLAFAAFYLRYGRWQPWPIAACCAVGPLAFLFVVFDSRQSPQPTSTLQLVALVWFGSWVSVGAPVASAYIARQRGLRSPGTWAIATFLTTTLALLGTLIVRSPAPKPRP